MTRGEPEDLANSYDTTRESLRIKIHRYFTHTDR